MFPCDADLRCHRNLCCCCPPQQLLYARDPPATKYASHDKIRCSQIDAALSTSTKCLNLYEGRDHPCQPFKLHQALAGACRAEASALSQLPIQIQLCITTKCCTAHMTGGFDLKLEDSWCIGHGGRPPTCAASSSSDDSSSDSSSDEDSLVACRKLRH